MKDPDKAIVCGACKIPVTCPPDPAPTDQIVCAKCGARDKYEDVWKVCLTHIAYRLKSASQSGYQKGLGNLAAANAISEQQGVFKWRIKDQASR